MKAMKFLFMFVLVVAAIVSGCKKDEAAPGGGSGPTYYGTFAGASETGSMTVAFASAPSKVGVYSPNEVAVIITVTGTIKIQGGATINLTGTYDTDTDSLKISGGGYTFEGTYSNGEVTGSYTGPSGSGGFTVGASTSGPAKVYCGEYTETSPGTGTGKINVIVDGTKVSVLVRDSSGDGIIVLKGTLEGSTLTIYFSGTTGPILATGTMNETATHMSGEYNSGDESGSWSADLCE